MKNNVKKISLLFALILVSSALFGVFGVSAEELIVNDYDIVFQENTGILKISGEQGMEDFYLELFDDNPDTGMPEYSYTTPWYVYADKAVKVKISGDINRISKNAFPEFYKMTSLHLTEKITEIEKTAFKDCTSLEKIYFGGSEAEWAAMTAETENLGNVTVYYEIPECTHEFVNYVSDNNATYFADGTKTAVCSLSEYCGETDTVTDTGSKLKLGKTSKITATQTKNSVTLKWNKVSKANAYRVYQRSGSSWKLIATTSSNTYKVEKLSAGTKYTFAVKACYVEGGKTAQAPSYTSFTTPTKPAKTTKISTSSTDTSIKLAWYKVKGATGYRIYVYNNGWKAVKTTTSNTYTVQNLKVGTKYTYAVKAYTKYNGAYIWASEYTSYKTATCPAKPAELKATKTTTSVTLSWSKVAGATGYRIYQYNPTTKSWDIVRKATTATKYTIKNLQGNKNYIFAVRPYIKNDTAYVYSKGFTQIKVKTDDASAIPSVTGVHSHVSTVTVKWKDVSDESGYQVWYSTSRNGTYKKYSNAKANSTSLTVKGLKEGKTYYFKVRAYKITDDGYVYSDFSSVKSVKIAVTPDYSEVIKEYRNAIRGYYNDYYGCEYINPYWPSHLGDLYYAYYDINSDGLNELVVSAEYDGKYENINLFTYDDHYDKPVSVFGQNENVWFGERVRLYIFEDGSIMVEGSDSAFESSCTIYSLPSGSTELEFVDGYSFVYDYHIVYDYLYDDFYCKNYWEDHCHQIDENYEFVDCLTPKEWDNLENHYVGMKRVPSTWKPVIEKRSLSSIVTNTKKKGANMAIAMMSGYCGDDAYDYDLHMHLWSKEGYIAEFPFIKDIPENRFFVEGSFSAETYLFVPVDCKEIRIYEYSDTWSGEKGNLVKVLTDGKPFIIKGGYEVEGPFIIEAKTNDGRKLTYEPFISAKDGSLRVGEVFYDLNS